MSHGCHPLFQVGVSMQLLLLSHFRFTHDLSGPSLLECVSSPRACPPFDRPPKSPLVLGEFPSERAHAACSGVGPENLASGRPGHDVIQVGKRASNPWVFQKRRNCHRCPINDPAKVTPRYNN